MPSTLRVAGKPKGLAAFAPTLQHATSPAEAQVGNSEHPFG